MYKRVEDGLLHKRAILAVLFKGNLDRVKHSTENGKKLGKFGSLKHP